MTNKVHLRTPVKIYTEGWVDTELVVTDDSLTVGKQKISLGEIEDLEEIDVNNVRCIQIKKDTKIIIQLPKNIHQQVFRYIAFNLKADKFAYISYHLLLLAVLCRRLCSGKKDISA